MKKLCRWSALLWMSELEPHRSKKQVKVKKSAAGQHQCDADPQSCVTRQTPAQVLYIYFWRTRMSSIYDFWGMSEFDLKSAAVASGRATNLANCPPNLSAYRIPQAPTGTLLSHPSPFFWKMFACHWPINNFTHKLSCKILFSNLTQCAWPL